MWQRGFKSKLEMGFIHLYWRKLKRHVQNSLGSLRRMSNSEIFIRSHIQDIFHNDVILSMDAMIARADAASSTHTKNRDDLARHPLTAFGWVIEPFPKNIRRRIIVIFKNIMSFFRGNNDVTCLHEILVVSVQVHT